MENLDNTATEELFPPNKARNRLVSLLIFIAIILSFIFYFFPFQNYFTKTQTLTKVYFADNITSAHLKIIKLFNEKYKGKIEVIPIDFNYEKFTTNKRKELITRSMRSRSGRIDIFSVDQIWIPRFAKWAEPLSKYFTHNELDSIIIPAYKTCIYDSVLYGIPLFMDLGIMYYRKDLIEKLPGSQELIDSIKNGITWEKLISLKNKFPSSYEYLFQGRAYEGLICNFLELLMGNGENVSKTDLLGLENPKIVNSFQVMVDLINKYNITPRAALDMDEAASFRYAIKNNIPFLRGWPTMYKLVNLSPKDSVKLKYLGIAPTPHFKGHESYSTLGGWNLMVSRYSEAKEAAVTFIKFTLSKEAQEILYSEGEYLPIIKSFYDDPELIKKYPRLTYYKELINNQIQRPLLERYTKISDILAYYLNKALMNDISVEDAMFKAENQIKEVLDSKDDYSKITKIELEER